MNYIRENRTSSQAGFSLLELLVSAFLLAVVTGSAVYLLNQTQASFRSQVELSQQTRQLQAALDQIVRYFRQAGADPLEATGASPVEIIATGHIRLNSDVTGEFESVTSDPKEDTGDPDGSLNSIYEQVEIRHDPQQDRVYVDIGYGEEVLAEEVTNLTFTFYDNSGAVTSDPVAIVRVLIRISGSADHYAPNMSDQIASITLEVNAFLRNRMAEVLLKGPDRGTKMKRNSESGSALVFIILISLLLTALGLGLTMTGMTEFSTSTELEAREKAFMIADGGFNEAKMAFRGNDPVAMLLATTTVPGYIHGNDGQYGYRNPLPLVEARNIDFDSPPNAVTSRIKEGLLTPATGQLLGGGRYFAKVSLEGMEHETDPLATVIANRQSADPNWSPTLVLRVVGIHESAPGVIGSTTSGRNAVSVVEGVLRRDMSFDIASPLTLVGPGINAEFSGNSFDIVGDANHTGMSLINDDPSSGDAAQASQDVMDALSHNQEDNISGAEGDYGPSGPSIEDGTDEVRNSTNADASNVMSAAFLESFATRIAAIADVVYPDPTQLSGSDIQLGTAGDPQITYAEGDLTLSGGGSGVGVLLVRGSFNYQGAFDYDGLILVLGEGDLEMGGANKDIRGGVLIANIIEDGNGGYTFGDSRLSVHGNSNFYFDSADIRMAVNLLPLKTLLWREVVPEIEP